MVAGVVFVVLLGGTPSGEISARIQLVMLLIGAVTVWAAIRAVRATADASDRLALLSYLFLLACVAASNLPRQSVEIGYSGMATLAIFWLARRELADERSSAALFNLLTAIALLVGGLAVVTWGMIWADWAIMVGSFPPQLELPAIVFGNVHDVAILVLICAPGALMRRSRYRRAFLALTVVVAVLILVLDGSRNILFAAGLATLLVVSLAWTRMRAPRRPRLFWWVLVGAFVLAALSLAFWTGLAARLLNPATLGVRIWLWSASVESWRADILFGSGPGTFPWLLSLTDYFSLTDFAPRHPDNALAQLLAEGGLVGVAGAAVAIVSVVLGARREAPPLPAIWALAFFAACGLFANPTDFGFLIVPAVLWASLATRRPPGAQVGQQAGAAVTWVQPLVQASTAVAAVTVFVAAITFGVAGLVYEEARTHFEAGGEPLFAANLVRVATQLDPSMALYQRDLGTSLLTAGDAERATRHLSQAVTANPSDLAAQRVLAVAALKIGALDLALDAARQAASQNPRDAANLIVLAQIEAARENYREATVLLSQALLDAPWAAGAFPTGRMGMHISTADAAAQAVDQIFDSGTLESRSFMEPAWLVALSGRESRLPAVVDAAAGIPVTSQALYDLFACRVARAEASLLAARATEGGAGGYWIVRYMVEQASGGASEEAAWFVTYVAGLSPGQVVDPEPATDNGRVDLWGYGLRPIRFTHLAGLPETERAGLLNWMRDPIETAIRQIPERPLASCRP